MIARRKEPLPFVHLLPSLVTVIGLCAGLTAIRFAYADKFILATALILLAAVLDGVDGQLARRLKSESPFGAELDSLCDFLDFGVAPGILVYQFALAGAPNANDIGWVLVLVYIVCCCLRLARFNVNRDAPTGGVKPHFTGVPAPAGALLALLPLFLTFGGVLDAREAPLLVAPWLCLVGLMLTRFWLSMALIALVYVASLIQAAIRYRGGHPLADPDADLEDDEGAPPADSDPLDATPIDGASKSSDSTTTTRGDAWK